MTTKTIVFKNDINQFKFLCGENLLKIYKRPTIQFKLNICEKTANWLKKFYNLNCSRYVNCSKILKDLNVPTLNKYNDDGDYHQIQSDSFKMKLIKPKKKRLVSITSKETIIESSYQLSVKFLRFNKINLTDADRNLLTQYAEL